MKNSLLVIGSVFVGLLVCPRPVHAVEYLNDDFVTGSGNYTAGVPAQTAYDISGQTSAASTGFSAAWTGGGTSYLTASTLNLSLPGYTSTSGSGSFALSPFNNGGSIGSHENSRAYTAVSGQSDLWFGTLVQTDSNTLTNGGQAMVGFLSGALTTTSSSTATGATWDTGNGGGLSGFAMGISGGGFAVSYQTGSSTITTQNLTFTVQAGSTYLLLAELEPNTSGNNDTLNVWALATAPTSQGSLGTPTFSITTANILSASSDLNTLVGYDSLTGAAGSTYDLSNFDAIRGGESFSDVVAVPEPSTYVLMILGLVVCLGFGRRTLCA